MLSPIRILSALTCGICLTCLAQGALATPSRSAPPARSVPRPPPRAAHPKPKAPSRATAKPAAAKPAAPSTSEAAPGPTDAPLPNVPDAHGPPSGANEAKVAPSNPAVTGVVKTEEAEKGVKTYTFGAEEVEGRMKSPQILYFLRRVRAEFDAEPLGHRSFLLELSDTRRHPSLE